MYAFLRLLFSIVLTVAVFSFQHVYAQDTFCCTYAGPEEQPCIVDANRQNCTYPLPRGTWEQNWCAQYNTDETTCNNSCTYCEYAQPSPTVPPGVPTQPPVQECYTCYSDMGNYWCALGGDNGDGTCRDYNNAYDCNQNCPPVGGQTKYRCDPNNISQPCVPSQNGQYNTIEECGQVCHIGVEPPTSVCEFVADPTKKAQCVSCFDPTPPTPPGSWTAIGCIQTDPAEFIKTLLGFGIGIAGGIAFLLILLGGFQILTSTGNPEQLSAGKELVSSAITGLLLIIFSIFLLRLIGFTILGIPGFR